MAYLKMGFVKKDPQGKGILALNDFLGVLKSTLKSVKDEKETFDYIVQYSQKQDDSGQDETLISFERLNTLIETYQFYPLIIKRDKNYSASIYSVLNANKSKEEMKVRNY